MQATSQPLLNLAEVLTMDTQQNFVDFHCTFGDAAMKTFHDEGSKV